MLRRSPTTTAEPSSGAGDRRGIFLHRLGLAGQRGFLRAQIRRADDPPVRGHDVARLQEHDVADDEVTGRDLQDVSVAPHLDVWDGEFLQCGDRLFGPELLIEAKHGVEHDNREDRDGVFVVTHGNRNHRRHDEDHDHRRGQLFPGDGPRAPHATFDQLVWSIDGQSSRSVRRGQPSFRVRTELCRCGV